MNHRTRWTLLLALVLLALAACTAAPQASAPTADPAAFARRLATVDLPPTPDDGQRRATQIAALPTATFRAPTLGITPTIYVGTFVGAEADEPSLPVVDPAQFLGTLGAPTEVAPELAACSVPADSTLGTVWPEQPGLADQLGCAAEAAVNSEGSSQVFERGLMAFVPSGEIWALQPGTAYWHTTQAPADRPGSTRARWIARAFTWLWRVLESEQQLARRAGLCAHR